MGFINFFCLISTCLIKLLFSILRLVLSFLYNWLRPIKYFHSSGTPVVHLLSMESLSAFYIFTPIGALLVGIVFAFIVFAVKYKHSEREREILRNARRGQSVDMETTAIIMEQKGPVTKDLKQNLGYGKSRFNKPSRFAKRGHRLP